MYAFRIVDGGMADSGVGDPARHPNLDSLAFGGESVGDPGQPESLADGRAEPRACYLAHRPPVLQDGAPVFGHRSVFHYEPDHPVAVTAFGDLLEGLAAYEIFLFELDGHAMSASSGLDITSVSWPGIRCFFSSRRTRWASTPKGKMPNS